MINLVHFIVLCIIPYVSSGLILSTMSFIVASRTVRIVLSETLTFRFAADCSELEI